VTYRAGIIGTGGIAGMSILGMHDEEAIGKEKIDASHAGGYSDLIDTDDDEGRVNVPDDPGLGGDYDWDYSEANSTGGLHVCEKRVSPSLSPRPLRLVGRRRGEPPVSELDRFRIADDPEVVALARFPDERRRRPQSIQVHRVRDPQHPHRFGMLDRISQLTVDSVTPSDSIISRWPSAVAPP
jgi:hypothetical protein